jgi:DNA-binding CsgD family transcriptional regulator
MSALALSQSSHLIAVHVAPGMVLPEGPFVAVPHPAMADVVLAGPEGAPNLEDSRVETPVVTLGGKSSAAGQLPADATPEQIAAALSAVAAGLIVRAPDAVAGFGPAAEPSLDDLLTPREIEVLSAMGLGASNKVIARQLGISLHTVKFYVEAVFRKLEAHSRAEAVAKGLRRQRTETIEI